MNRKPVILFSSISFLCVVTTANAEINIFQNNSSATANVSTYDSNSGFRYTDSEVVVSTELTSFSKDPAATAGSYFSSVAQTATFSNYGIDYSSHNQIDSDNQFPTEAGSVLNISFEVVGNSNFDLSWALNRGGDVLDSFSHPVGIVQRIVLSKGTNTQFMLENDQNGASIAPFGELTGNDEPWTFTYNSYTDAISGEISAGIYSLVITNSVLSDHGSTSYNNMAFHFDVTPVPLPATLLTFIAGLGVVSSRIRKRTS